MTAGGRNPQPYDPLEILLADRVLGPAAKLAFLVLWKYAGCQVGRVCITAAWLGARLGGSPRAAWDWLQALQKNDLIRIGERTRRGSIEIWIFHPSPGHREAIPDPQRRFPSVQPEGVADPTPDREAIPGPDSDGDVVGGLHAETPEQKTANSSGKTAHATSDSGVCVSKTPESPKNSKKDKNLNSQILKVPKEFNEFIEPAGVSAPKPPSDPNERFTAEARSALGRSTIATAERPRVSPRRTVARRGEEPTQSSAARFSTTVGQATCGVLDRSRPAEAKSRLMEWIQSVIGEPVSQWVLSSAANLVIYHDLPLQEVKRILVDFETCREMIKTPAAWFHAKARRLADQHGKPWPRREVERNTEVGT